MEMMLLRVARAEDRPARLGGFGRAGHGSVHPTVSSQGVGGGLDVGGRFLPADEISPCSAEEQSFIPDVFQCH